MLFAAAHYTGVATRLSALRVAVFSTAQSVLGHLPTEVLQADVMWEMVVKF
jgi:hypothetical protein